MPWLFFFPVLQGLLHRPWGGWEGDYVQASVCTFVSESFSLLSALGELRVDEAAELGWPSLTSMPLSCWSPLSNLPQSTTDTDTAAAEGGRLVVTTVVGADAVLAKARELLTVTATVTGVVLEAAVPLLPIGPTVVAKLMGLVHALIVGGGAGAMETTVGAGLAAEAVDMRGNLTAGL